MITSYSFVHRDFKTSWYRRWARELKQDMSHLEGYALYANKFWQNAVMTQALYERGVIKSGKRGIGFGVGRERLPALFASHGVAVTATDQDFRTVKAGHWAAQELATSSQSLNRLKVCKPSQFKDLVEYMPVDMTKVPKSLDGKYDFLWSNCALGHPGSIPAGLNFITRSMRCLQAGGWAVHTTELNILSDKETVTGGSTVVFRLHDMYELHVRLIKAGYIMEPFQLRVGDLPADQRISMRPQFGNDYSKIQIMGHLGTQIVLIIHKPLRQITAQQKLQQRLIAWRAYRHNLTVLRRYKKTDETVRPILQAQHSPVSKLTIQPQATEIKLNLKKGQASRARLIYSNNSALPLFGMYNRLGDNKPITLATSHPRDRSSEFATKNWITDNRVTSEMYVQDGKRWILADYVLPGQVFSFVAELRAPKRGRVGERYTEHFELVQELAGWLDGTNVSVHIQLA